MGGLIVASQVSMRMNLPLCPVDFSHGAPRLDPTWKMAGARLAIVDDFVTSIEQFNATIKAVTDRGADVVAIGAAVALPVRPNDLHIPLNAALVLVAQIFASDQVPDWLEAIPIQNVSTWRTSS